MCRTSVYIYDKKKDYFDADPGPSYENNHCQRSKVRGILSLSNLFIETVLSMPPVTIVLPRLSRTLLSCQGCLSGLDFPDNSYLSRLCYLSCRHLLDSSNL